MRITTNTIIRNYTNSLNRSMGALDSARNKVLTNRKFSKASQDPAGAAKAAILRREFQQNSDHIANAKEVQSRVQTVESSMMQISKAAEDAYVGYIQGVNGTTSPEQRKVLATQLRELQATMVKDANVLYGDQFLFGGTSMENAPFSLDNGVLSYQGLPVDSADPAVQAKLKSLAEETIYTDLGFGLEMDASGEIKDWSAFNTTIPGIAFLGYGENEEGVPKNLISVMGKMADALEAPTLDQEEFKKLTTQFDAARDTVLYNVTRMGTQSKFVENTISRLEDTQDNLNEKIHDAEYVDMAGAISDYVWYQYAYNAALKVGNSILSSSFIDFMS